MGQLDAIKEAEKALLRAHAAFREAARLDPSEGQRIEMLYRLHELTLRRIASDLNEIHATEAEAQHLADQQGN